MPSENTQIYVILTASEAEGIVFSEVEETSAATLRWNVAGTETVVKFPSGPTPSFLEGKTQYTHAQILDELDNAQWNPPPPA